MSYDSSKQLHQVLSVILLNISHVILRSNVSYLIPGIDYTVSYLDK